MEKKNNYRQKGSNIDAVKQTRREYEFKSS